MALASGDRVMMRVLAGERQADRRRASSTDAIGSSSWRSAWRAIKPGGQLDFATALARELVSVRRAGKVFVISDFLMMLNSVTRGLGLFTAANMDVTAVQILGGSEMAGEGLTGDVEVVDAETGERVTRVDRQSRARSVSPDAAAAFARDQSLLPARGLHYTLYTTDLNFHDFFLRASADFGLRRH